MSRNNTLTRRQRKEIKRREAETRNAQSHAGRQRRCGHVHGEGVGCQGRVFLTPQERLIWAIFGPEDDLEWRFAQGRRADGVS